MTTNVPGPRKTLYGLGREGVEMLPYAPIADRPRIGVAMFSCRDTLTSGITGDYDTAPRPRCARRRHLGVDGGAGLGRPTSGLTRVPAGRRRLPVTDLGAPR